MAIRLLIAAEVKGPQIKPECAVTLRPHVVERQLFDFSRGGHMSSSSLLSAPAVVSRRRFLSTAAASLGASSVGWDAWAQDVCRAADKKCTTPACFPPPDFSLEGSKSWAGVRPHREHSYRLAPVEVGGKFVVHNYGHGGAGITLSLGCAEKVTTYVRDIIQHHAGAASDGIAVLGAGVMGLTAATALVKAFPGTKIDIYTKETYAKTTSIVAGGQWAPASVLYGGDKAALKVVLKSSLKQFKALKGKTWGVSERRNYTLYDDGGLNLAFELGLIDKEPIDDPMARLPFRNMNCSGYVYKTLLIEPPIFLKKLHNDLVEKFHVDFKTMPFPKRAQGEAISGPIANLKQKIIVNCTGLAGGDLFHDDQPMTPIKGHLILLQPQNLDYLFSGYQCGDWVQYLFPRSDGIVVGGTYQRGRNDAKTSFNVGVQMVATMKRLFEGKLAPQCDVHDIAQPKCFEGPDVTVCKKP